MTAHRLGRHRLVVVYGFLLALGAATAAQRFRLPEGPGVPPRYPPRNFGDGAFVHCKIKYTSVWREAQGTGWATDYPYVGINLMTRVSELTKTPISVDARGDPNYWVVSLTIANSSCSSRPTATRSASTRCCTRCRIATSFLTGVAAFPS